MEITILQYVHSGVRTKNSIRTQWECCANSANRPLTLNGTTFKARWTLQIKEEAEFKEAKEAELKEEEEAELKEARTKQVTAERTPKDKGKVKEQAEGRMVTIGKLPKREVSRLLTVKKPRHARTEQDAGICATMVIALNGTNAGKSRKLNRNAEMRKRTRWRATLGIEGKQKEPVPRAVKTAAKAALRAVKTAAVVARRATKAETAVGKRPKRSLPKLRLKMPSTKPWLNQS